ncbi:MAG: FAD-dependent oxidoreductase [Alteromonadaceae bacterium]|nr:FAD-dependent oxidoreductase [Alteromonadaceae bacterium]
MPKVTSDNPAIRQVAIIGSGVAGLTAAIFLSQQGHRVQVFDKSRGPGGRLSAKRVGNDGSVDIGAQYFTIRNPAFREFLGQWAGDEHFAHWPGRFGFQHPESGWQPFPEEQRYVGTPRMTAISRALSRHVELQSQVRIKRLLPDSGRWQLVCTDGKNQGHFDQVVITAPPAQAGELLADSGLTPLADRVANAAGHMLPCWAVAARLEQQVPMAYEGMRPNSDTLYWVANNASKPGRSNGGQWWVLHATPEWTRHHLDTEPDLVAERLVGAFRDLTGYQGAVAETLSHRWLYARSTDGACPGYLLDREQGIGLAGDWLAGGRVEGAWESAEKLVAEMTG